MANLTAEARRTFQFSVAISALYLVIYFVALQTFGNESQAITQLRGNLASVVGDALALTLCLVSIKPCHSASDTAPPRLWSIHLIGVSCLLFAVADALWAYLEWNKQETFPSVADYFYLAFIPCLLMAVLLLPSTRLPKIARMRIMLDGMLILTALVAFSWNFILGPTIIGNHGVSLLARVLGVAYPAGDLLLATCFVVLFLRGGNRAIAPAILCFGTGLILLSVGDSVFLYQSLKKTFVSGTPLDLAWPGSALLYGLAARYLRLTASEGIKTTEGAVYPVQGGNEENRWWSLARASLPYLLVPFVGILFFTTVMRSHERTILETGVYISASILVGLIVLRQFVFLAENVQLFRQTRLDADNLKHLNRKLQATQAELVHSAKMASLGTLSAGVAHELNQPVAIARGISQQLLAEEDLPDYAREDLLLIEVQTGRMMQIIQHLRTYCRTTGFDVEPTSLNKIVRDNFTLLGAQLKAHGVTLQPELMESDPLASVNPNEIEQVFLNLITNARDALENCDGAVLRIRSGVEGDTVWVEFADNGPGIPQNTLERIFDPFFTTKEVGKGTGLGLSISQNLIQKNGGTLKVRNENGAVFTVTLPRVAETSDYTKNVETNSDRNTAPLLQAV